MNSMQFLPSGVECLTDKTEPKITCLGIQKDTQGVVSSPGKFKDSFPEEQTSDSKHERNMNSLAS